MYRLGTTTSRYGRRSAVGRTKSIVTAPTPDGQAAWLRDLLSIVRAVPDGRGLGAFWWEATWTAVDGNGWSPVDPQSGNGWENQALFDYNDRLLPAADELLRR
jgi:arabinogalactan endo-1,4-beta-galactosidase